MIKPIRWLCLLLIVSLLTGCFYWVRVYKVYLQMKDFDQHFSITSEKKFTVNFKDPVLYSDDFVSLSKLQPSTILPLASGERWRYWFQKVDEKWLKLSPGKSFYFDLYFNQEKRLTHWIFSPLFMQIAPAEFLEVSLRSLSTAEINKGKKQLKANVDSIEKIKTELPKKTLVVNHLAEPLAIKQKAEQEELRYHFLLDTHDIKEGYEDRARTIINLTFDNEKHELVRMAGRFAGLKVSINYKKYQQSE
ncbi:MAG: hypothetical protein KAT04_08655 [Methylococcales bacterium]|nr:hypothetical protein [Methylococcales bacterium]